jgi:hypothetical protein
MDSVELQKAILNSTPEELKAILQTYDPLTWALETAKVRLPKEGSLDFSQHPFLVDVYRDCHTEIVLLKGAQLGFSTWAICRVIWMVLTYASTVIYTFPTRDDVSEYTATRINPIINLSPYIKGRVLDVDSVRVKQFSKRPGDPSAGVSIIHFNGAQNEKDATTVDGDMLVHDEEDRSNARVIEQYGSRLDHSRFKWKIRLSTPTIPGHGVHKGYMASNKGVWMIQCPSCNERFELQFPRNIEPKEWVEVEAGHRAYYVCHKCGRELPEDTRLKGEWVFERDNPLLAHGYQLSQMSAPWVPAWRILQKKNDATYEGDFYNLVLGQPWESGANVMSRAAIELRMSDEPMTMADEGCFMGVDIGRSIDVVIGKWHESKPRTVRIVSVTTWSELDDLMRQYGVMVCVVDALPEERDAKAFQDRWNTPGLIRVWRCVYREPSSQSAQRDIFWRDTKDSKTGEQSMNPIVSVPRDDTLSASSAELLGTRVLPRFDGSPWYEAYLEHHEASKKVPVWQEGLEKERVKERDEWVATGADHFFHAATYEMIARLAPRPVAPPTEHGMRTFSSGRRSRTGTRVLDRPPSVKVQRYG